VAGTHQHATFPGGDGEDVAGLDDVVGLGILGHGHLDGLGPVMGGDAGSDALGSLDGDGEGGTVDGLVVPGHLGQAEQAGPGLGDGEADEATAKLGHEVDGFGGDVFSGEDQVPFIFPILFVHQDNHLASTHVGNDLLDGGQGTNGCSVHGFRLPD